MSLNLDFTLSVAEWLLDLGDEQLSRGEPARALECHRLAARTLATQNRDLSFPRLEASLQRIAALLPRRAGALRASGRREAWLHVLNKAFPHGGHTAMATRWITNDRSDRTHNVALLSQRMETPEKLRAAISARGGSIHVVDPDRSLLDRADWLRSLAYETATHVVLHVGADDVIASTAFGVAGGPPVLLINHAAHQFWVGTSTTDLVVNCRGSELEESWTLTHRGAVRCATVPIPLDPPESETSASQPSVPSRAAARRALGIPEHALVIVTTGDSFKYTPALGLDFLSTLQKVLSQLPDAHLLAIGPEEDSRWKEARERSGSRIRTIGRQPSPLPFYAIADLYIEGFPFGSTTALLEAGICGLPVILAPVECPPPYGSDGIALDTVLHRPCSVEEYAQMIVRLGTHAAERHRIGARLAASIRRHHTGTGWQEHLEAAVRRLPPEHATVEPRSGIRTPQAVHEYWTTFRDLCLPHDSSSRLLDRAIAELLAAGVKPTLPGSLMAACKRAAPIRSGRTVPRAALRFMCNALFRALPLRLASATYDGIASVCRPHSRTMAIVSGLLPESRW